jgi:hypothetical protein
VSLDRKLIALVATGLALVVAPSLALAGATQSTESWTDEPTNFFTPNACVRKQVTGSGLESGTAWITETPSGGTHVRGAFHGRIALYEALGPGPWDPQPGAYVGTWTYDGTFSDQAPPDESGAVTGTSHGPFVLADGRSLMLSSQFHLTFDKAGNPPKLFFAHFECAGSGQFAG